MNSIDLGALALQYLLMRQYQARAYPLSVLFQVTARVARHVGRSNSGSNAALPPAVAVRATARVAREAEQHAQAPQPTGLACN